MYGLATTLRAAAGPVAPAPQEALARLAAAAVAAVAGVHREEVGVLVATGGPGGGGSSGTAASGDPNSLIGPAGFGPAGLHRRQPFPYRIDFENEPTATAPAQRVDITDQLDPNLDWSTFQFTGVGFGDNIIAIPADSQHFQTTVPMT